MDRIKNAPEDDTKKIAKAIAEGVDGDAVATCIGLAATISVSATRLREPEQNLCLGRITLLG